MDEMVWKIFARLIEFPVGCGEEEITVQQGMDRTLIGLQSTLIQNSIDFTLDHHAELIELTTEKVVRKSVMEGDRTDQALAEFRENQKHHAVRDDNVRGNGCDRFVDI